MIDGRALRPPPLVAAVRHYSGNGLRLTDSPMGVTRPRVAHVAKAPLGKTGESGPWANQSANNWPILPQSFKLGKVSF